jgi:hypothetical protein
MVRVSIGAALLGAALAASAAAQVGGDVAKQDDKPKRLKLDSLSPSLLSKIVGRYLERDYKGNKDKEKIVEALAPLGGVDKVADNLNYQFKDGKPQFVYNAVTTPRPANADEVEAALRDVLEYTFTQLAKQPEQIDKEKYAIDKAEADKVVAEFPAAVRVLWRPSRKEPIPPVPMPIKDRPAKGGSPTPLPKPSSASAGGKWKLVVSGYATDCCGHAVPVYRWAWQKPNGSNGANAALSNGAGEPPVPVDGLRAADAPKMFWLGYRLFWQGEYEAAWRQFDGAARLADDDARYWYFKALAEQALGREDDAVKSRRRGAELQAVAKPSAEAVGRALERVQGPQRMWLREGLDTLGTRP